MKIKPTSACEDMRIYYTIDVVSHLLVSAILCDHLQGGVFEGYITKNMKTS